MMMISLLCSILLSSLKVWIRLFILFLLSIVLYGLFYQWYVPHFISTFPVFFQYNVACSQLSSTLHAQADNGLLASTPRKLMEDCQFVYYDLQLQQDYFFKRGQLYNFEVRFDMPDSHVNQNLGMFMIRLLLFDVDDKQLFGVARPALYPYQSKYLRLIKLVAWLPFYLAGYFKENYSLNIRLIDEHVAHLASLPFAEIHRIRLEVETYKAIEISPPSHLYITARLQGIQYWMYFWPITSFIIGTCIIFFPLATLYLARLSFNLLRGNPTDFGVSQVSSTSQENLPLAFENLPPAFEPQIERLPELSIGQPAHLGDMGDF